MTGVVVVCSVVDVGWVGARIDNAGLEAIEGLDYGGLGMMVHG